ncbi:MULTISPECIES: methionine ABC transporter ATP-binding protein [Priestia]|uniref:methionine ABC transporter ATP-binding protein n=1 Tax=Priestia TaxID=2800373 RepID=UPI0007CDC64A|nr:MULTISPECIES: ATP-binding cassette domain-containing protein [Priestia]ANF45564.1 methionine ABC transporter ATP-binding protein [Priestia megaterium]AQU73234.1 methionine ABC transporter ATP-binding protein [Priestia megaterium]MCU7764857.1 ATP-binding cassette domain-containing protein [Priestia megaterium]
MIELKKTSKTYKVNGKAVEAVKDVSLTINKGEVFGVIGYSGAGKSTLIRCINLLEKPTSGEVIIDGKNLSKLSKQELQKTRRKIGMIFQGYNLLKTATVYDNIAIPLKLEGVNKKLIQERVEKYLSIVGLLDKQNHYPSQLSGGQKQRVAIARALAHEPEILLSDEATSALDPETTEAILCLLLKINKELGLTIFLITHELNVVQRICDRIAVMENGYVVEQGTVVSLFTNPKHPTTKRFVESENTFTIPSEIMASYRSTGKLVSLHFVGNELSEEPALALVSRKFNVLPSILAGGIEQLKNHTLGKLLVHLRGEKEEYEQAITYLTNQGVIVEEVN